MDILPLNFRVLWFCGAWSERKESNPFVRFLNFCYRYAIVILIYEFTISEVIELVRTRDHIEDITEGLFLTLTYVALCFKYGNFLVRRGEVSTLLNCFRGETCQPKNFEEQMILIKYDRKAKWCVRTFMSISQATCWALVFAPIVGPQDTDRPLPFKTYMPYSISGWYLYVATYLQHVAAIFYGVLLNVSFDSLVYGFILHACGQIDLLRHRLYAVLLLIYQLTISEVIELIRMRNHIDDVTEVLFLTSTFVTLCLKYANFLLRRDQLSTLLECLRVKMCQPRNFKERLIIEAHSRKAKWSTLSFLIISHATGLGLIITPALEAVTGERVLPLKSYIPYSITRLLPYAATYLQQAAAIFYAIMLNVSFDSLVYGLTIHACGQIELICRRLTDDLVTSEKRSNTSIEECVKHHVLVYAFVKGVETLFIWTVTILFFFSLIIFCTSIFLITKTKLFSAEFFSLLLYFSGIMLQIFFYCWYGNELELKSRRIANAIYFSDWTMATPRERRSLVLIMINSQKGFVFSYHGLFTLCLDTFTWIFKTSYSAFNLLQHASN
ncbi:odorant receptor 46a-like [Odontomachus brunneus]|uniref:odorant receptor 46a-like n=1 Tax=Odontomachus brunneus TaxID=486640 RepID=UPI0013F1CCD9|nr:odorant receptor 46a-like [Odontomachus brunneus]